MIFDLFDTFEVICNYKIFWFYNYTCHTWHLNSLIVPNRCPWPIIFNYWTEMKNIFKLVVTIDLFCRTVPSPSQQPPKKLFVGYWKCKRGHKSSAMPSHRFVKIWMKNRLDYIDLMLVSNQRDCFRPQVFFKF